MSVRAPPAELPVAHGQGDSGSLQRDKQSLKVTKLPACHQWSKLKIY
jgi:hypothetical protein